MHAGANLPSDSDEYAWCMTCISETYAQPEPTGILTLNDYNELMKNKEWRLNDFGKCATMANHTYWCMR